MSEASKQRPEYSQASELDADDWDADWMESCGECGGEGYVLADCFEDTCCCADPETEHGYIRCQCNPRRKR